MDTFTIKYSKNVNESEIPEMGQYSEGTDSFQQFAIRIAEMLQDFKKFQELFSYLQKVGFQAA